MNDGSDAKEHHSVAVAWGAGDRAALDELVPLVHSELRRIARNYMRGERRNSISLLGGRPMVGLQTLDLAIGVRVRASQPKF
jgi:hypothetical protein